MPLPTRPSPDGFGVVSFDFPPHPLASSRFPFPQGLGVDIGFSGAAAVAIVAFEILVRPSCDEGKSALVRSYPLDLTLTGLNEYLSKMGNKDKMARVMHYGSRMMKGIFKDVIPNPFWNEIVGSELLRLLLGPLLIASPFCVAVGWWTIEDDGG